MFQEIKDAWLDNVDWAGIKQKAGKQWVDKDQEVEDKKKTCFHEFEFLER